MILQCSQSLRHKRNKLWMKWYRDHWHAMPFEAFVNASIFNEGMHQIEQNRGSLLNSMLNGSTLRLQLNRWDEHKTVLESGWAQNLFFLSDEIQTLWQISKVTILRREPSTRARTRSSFIIWHAHSVETQNEISIQIKCINRVEMLRKTMAFAIQMPQEQKETHCYTDCDKTSWRHTAMNCYKNMQLVKLFDKIPTDRRTERHTNTHSF